MKTLFLSLILLSATAAQAAEAPVRLECQEEPNSADPYKKLKDSNSKRMQNDAKALRAAGATIQARADMLASLMADYVDLCKARKMLESLGIAYEFAAKDEAVTQGKGALEKISEPTKTVSKAGADFDSTLDNALKRQKANYEKFFQADVKAVPQSALTQPAVKESFKKAWGMAPGENPTNASRKAGQFSNLLREIEGERAQSKSRQAELEKLAKKVEENKVKAASLIGDENTKAGAAPPKVDANGDGKIDEQDRFPPAPGADTNTDTTQPPPRDTLLGPVEKTPTQQSGGGIGEWASRNKGALIVGAGAAAVVGGVLWYKHEKDKKDKEADSASTTTSTSTSTSTSTNAVTSGNGYSLSASGFPSSAVVNQIISPISVVINGPSGQISDSGIQVTISCTNTCPITGTLTRKTINGSVEFDNISFTGAISGVQLRISASGLNSVASPGSFDVTSTSGRE